MTRAIFFIDSKLLLISVLSSILLLFGAVVNAHEVRPAVTDLEIVDGTLILGIDLNLEAYLSGIDLDGLEDTDEAEQSDDYDAFRALSPVELVERVPDLIARWNSLPLIAVDDAAVPLSLQSADIPDVGNPDTIRSSRITLTGPAIGDQIVMNWPSGAGDMVLRQNGVPDPFTGYLAGGEASPPLAISGGSDQSGWGAFKEFIFGRN